MKLGFPVTNHIHLNDSKHVAEMQYNDGIWRLVPYNTTKTHFNKVNISFILVIFYVEVNFPVPVEILNTCCSSVLNPRFSVYLQLIFKLLWKLLWNINHHSAVNKIMSALFLNRCYPKKGYANLIHFGNRFYHEFWISTYLSFWHRIFFKTLPAFRQLKIPKAHVKYYTLRI